MGINLKKIRKEFLILKRKVNGKPLVYLDNAATTQKPANVIKAISNFYSYNNSNVHRGIHKLSEESTELYESSREKVKKFTSSEEVVFTRNATEAINLVANSLDFKKGDEVVTTIMEHHSNLVPWIDNKDIKVKFMDIDKEGRLDMTQLGRLLTKKTKLVAITGCSNVLGTINDLDKAAKIAHENGSLILADCAQLAAHKKVDLKEIDFAAVSAHKMLGPTGIGALCSKKHILEGIKPFMKGGDMIKEVTKESATWNDVPYKFEAGTPNIAGAVGFKAAIEFLEKIGMEEIEKHETQLISYAMKKAESLDVNYFGPKSSRSGIFSFNLDNIHGHDVATILDSEGIAIRSGHLCAQPLLSRMGLSSVCRASFYLYNSEEEIDLMFDALKKARKVMG